MVTPEEVGYKLIQAPDMHGSARVVAVPWDKDAGEPKGHFGYSHTWGNSMLCVIDPVEYVSSVHMDEPTLRQVISVLNSKYPKRPMNDELQSIASANVKHWVYEAKEKYTAQPGDIFPIESLDVALSASIPDEGAPAMLGNLSSAFSAPLKHTLNSLIVDQKNFIPPKKSHAGTTPTGILEVKYDVLIVPYLVYQGYSFNGNYTGAIAREMKVEQVEEMWGLPHLNAPEAAADFYMLEYLVSVKEYEPAIPFQQRSIRNLAHTFATYLNYAVGGELRHILRFNRWANLSDKHRRFYPDPEVMAGKHRSMQRTTAWAEWHRVFKKFGPAAVLGAEEMFTQYHWDGSYGGRRWSKIAKLLHQYLMGNIPAKVFVDSTWSMQHNGGMALNKSNRIHGLDNELGMVLDAHRLGHIETISRFCSPTVRELARRAGVSN